MFKTKQYVNGEYRPKCAECGRRLVVWRSASASEPPVYWCRGLHNLDGMPRLEAFRALDRRLPEFG